MQIRMWAVGSHTYYTEVVNLLKARNSISSWKNFTLYVEIWLFGAELQELQRETVFLFVYLMESFENSAGKKK